MLFEPRINFNLFTHLSFKKSWSTSKKRKSPGGSSETPRNHHHHHRRSFRATSFNPPRHDWRRHFLEPWTCEQPKRKTEPPSGFYFVIRFLAHDRKNPQWNLQGKTNTSSKKKRSILLGAMGFFVQNEPLSTKVWEWPVLPVVICQSQWCVPPHLNYPSRTPLTKDFLLKSGSINHHYLLLRKAFYRVIGAHQKTPQLSARTPHRNFVSMRSRVPVKHMQRPQFVFSWSFLHPGKLT